MTAVLYQIRDYQSKRAIERAHKELEKEAAKILSAIPTTGTAGFTDTSPCEMNHSGIDGLWKDTDPA